MCVNDKFSKSFKSFFGENAAYNFINPMVKESKCIVVIFILTKNL